ncbi:MAG TPA: uroporphyrinogen-III synthase [Pyrinomonadaceae bacterium]|nr:uroporphyrinogen-III synthase [Pyrinomonadaceae bacterium]
MDQPLAGRTVVVTRAASQAAPFVSALENYGASVISCPTIEIAEPKSYERLDEAIDHLYGYDWLIFTSANGVDYFLRRLNTRGVNVAELDDLKVCAIGEATADKLRDAHIHVDVIPSRAKAEGVFAALTEFAGGTEKLHGLNFLIPRAATGRDYVPKSLENAGARVDVVTAYRTVLPENLDRGRLSAMLTGSADCIAFMSSSSVKNLALLFDTHDLGEKLQGLAIACIGDVTAATAAEYGLHVDIQPHETTAAALADAVAKYFQDTKDADGLN